MPNIDFTTIVRRRLVDEITDAAGPDNMTPEQAIELYEEIIAELESYVEALKEENAID